MAINLSANSAILLSGFIISNVCFIFSAQIYYALSKSVLKDDVLAKRATTLYCFNPASIFMSSLYTESLFALLSLSGMLSVRNKSTWLATVCFCLAAATRSNGIICYGFIAYELISKVININNIVSMKSFHIEYSNISFIDIITALLQFMIICLPYAIIQYYGYYTYCDNEEWCSNLFVVPNFYGHIQSKYWNQGFLHYYQAKQIPNFILALPVLVVAATSAVSYAASAKRGSGFYTEDCLPYVCYLFAMTVFAFAFMHVQVATRFVASSPAFHWWAAAQLSAHKSIGIAGKLIIFYYVSYYLIGPLLFTNFYPWT